MPHACMVTLKMQQRIDELMVSHLMDEKTRLESLKRLKPDLLYSYPRDISNVTSCSLSDG